MTEEDLKLVHSLAEKEGAVEAPTDLNLTDTYQVELPELEWRHYDNPPVKLVVTNTGHTINVGGKWECNRSYLRDGPFKGNYVFAQMHFHWGPSDDTGSEHSVEKRKLPLEMHVVHINRMYRSQEMALKEKDGVAIVTYLFEIQEEDNVDIDPIISALPLVSLPQTSTQIDPVPIGSLIIPFQRDYLLYWGSVSSPKCQHVILWLTCRTPLGISSNQLSKFRQVRDVNGQFMVKNYRETHPRRNHTLFHVSPSTKLESTLLAVYPGHTKVQEQAKQQEERLQEELSKTAAEEPPGAFVAEETSENTEPLASLDAEAAAGAVSEAKAAEDAQAPTAPVAVASGTPPIAPSEFPAAVPSAAPSGVPVPSLTESGALAIAPSAAPPGTPVSVPSVAPVTSSTKTPSGVPVAPSAVPSGVPISSPSAVPSSTPVLAPSAVPSGLPVAGSASTALPGAEGPDAVSSAKTYEDPSTLPAERADGAMEVTPSAGGTPKAVSTTPSKVGASASKTSSKVPVSKTPSARGVPTSGNKSPGASRISSGIPLTSSASRGGTAATPKTSARAVSSKGRVSGQVECVSGPVGPIATASNGENPSQEVSKIDLGVTLLEVPAVTSLPEEITTQGGYSTDPEEVAVISETVAPVGVPSAYSAVEESVQYHSSQDGEAPGTCPPCPPCPPNEVIPDALPESPPEAAETLLEEPADNLMEEPAEASNEETAEAPAEQPTDIGASEEPGETILEQQEEAPPEELSETQLEEPAEAMSEQPPALPLGGPAVDTSTCPAAPICDCGPSQITDQGPSPDCPPCPPCPHCGATITRDSHAPDPSQISPGGQPSQTGQNLPQDELPPANDTTTTVSPTTQTVLSEDCPPGFVKVSTVPDGEECPPGFVKVSAVTVNEGEECPPGYVKASTLLAKSIQEASSLPKQTSSQPKTQGKAPPPAASKGFPTEQMTAKQNSKIPSRPKSSNGTPRPSRPGSKSSALPDAPTEASQNQGRQATASARPVESPPVPQTLPRSPAQATPSVAAGSEASQPVYVRPGEDCPPGFVRASQSSGVPPNGPSEVPAKTPSLPSAVQGSDANAPVFVKEGEDCPPGYVKVSQMAGAKPGSRPDLAPIYVKAGEKCPPGYVKAVSVNGGGSTGVPPSVSQDNKASEPVYVRSGEECPPGYVKVASGHIEDPSAGSQIQAKEPASVRPREDNPPSQAGGQIEAQPGAQPATSLTQNNHTREPVYVRPDEECPPGYVKVAKGPAGSPSRSTPVRGIEGNAPIYVQPGEECPPGYVKATPSPAGAQTPAGPPAGAHPGAQSEVLQGQNSEVRESEYVKPGEECPPGYVRAPSQAAAPTGSSHTQGSDPNAPVYVRPGEECPPGYVRAVPSQPRALSSGQAQGSNSTAPVFVKPGEECPPGYVKVLPSQTGASQLPGSKASEPVYVRPDTEFPPAYASAPLSSSTPARPSGVSHSSAQPGASLGLPGATTHESSVRKGVPSTLHVAPGEECPPGYVKDPPEPPHGVLPNQVGAPLESLYVRQGEDCPPKYVKSGSPVSKAPLEGYKQPFRVGPDEQCPEGYVKVCKNKSEAGNPADRPPTFERKPATQPLNKTSSVKLLKGPGGKDLEERLPQSKTGSATHAARFSDRGPSSRQAEILPGQTPVQCASVNNVASPTGQLGATSERDLKDGPHSAGTLNYSNESNVGPTRIPSERIRKSNLFRTSSSGRVAAEDNCDDSETPREPSRKSSSGRSNIRKSDTIRSMTDEAGSDNRSLSYDECQSHRSAVSVKQSETARHDPLCVYTIADLAISERELTSEASVPHRSRSHFESLSSTRFQPDEGDRCKLTVRISEKPRREGSSAPSHQSLTRAVSSVRVASVTARETAEDQGRPEEVSSLVAEEPMTDNLPTDSVLEEAPVDSERRSGEGDEQPVDTDGERKPVNEIGEGVQLDGDFVMSLREPAFLSISGDEAPTATEAAPKTDEEEKALGTVAISTGRLAEVHAEVEAEKKTLLSDAALPISASREESARRFKYFQPPVEPRKPAPMPVFFNGLAVTPIVILPASMDPTSSKAKSNAYGSKINIPCGGRIPCHGRARRQWEEERALWTQDESSRTLLQEANNALQRLPDNVRSELATEAARRRKFGRSLLSGPEYDIPDKTGWPFEPYESKTPLMSPIDIMSPCVIDRQLIPLTFEGHFFPPARSMITNTGDTVEIRTVDPNCTPVLHGGPLMDDYIFESMHFHWSNGPGTECLGGTHRINGRRFCMEGHMIHFKSEYTSKAEALKHEGGICCVAFMLQVGGMENECFGRMSHELYRISEPQSKAALDFNALQTFASRACPYGYITYPGTLIGVQDLVNVIWIVYSDPIDICCQNVTQFQNLRPRASSKIPTGCVPAFDVAKRPVLRAIGPNI